MPTYDYLCRGCGHRLEIFQPMTESPKKKCPKCGKSRLERQIGTGAAILFKGSGFYQTDYRSSSYTEGAKRDAPKDAAGDGAKQDSGASAPKNSGGSSTGDSTGAGTPKDPARKHSTTKDSPPRSPAAPDKGAKRKD